MNCWPLQNGKGTVLLTCHQVAGLSSQVIVPYQGLGVGLCCWQIRPSETNSYIGLGKWEFILLGACVAFVSALTVGSLTCCLHVNQRSIPRYGIRCFQNLKAHQALGFIIVGDARCRNLSFILEGMSPQTTDYWTLKKLY
uniref:Uncharacterized protein n=1 Tax=Macaca fascicularis TaxID=9541 RepID=A0A7N9IDH7_MACFA